MDELEQLADTPDSNAADNAAAEDQHHDEQLSDDQVDQDSQEQPEEDEEVEIGGKKVAMPRSIAAEVKAGTMRQADYTQKTQAVAEERRQVEAERASVRQQAEQQQQYLDDVAELRSIDRQIKQFADLDWNALSDQDPVGAQKLHFQYQALQAQRQQAAQAVTQKQNEYALAEQQNLAKQAQEADAYVQREITGWTPERGAALNAYVQAQGLRLDQSLAKVLVANPALVKLFDKAEKFDQLVKKQTTKPQAPAAPPPPVQRVGAARASAKPDPDKMTTEQWMKHRNEQLRKR